jgi:hypothetical protein
VQWSQHWCGFCVSLVVFAFGKFLFFLSTSFEKIAKFGFGLASGPLKAGFHATGVDIGGVGDGVVVVVEDFVSSGFGDAFGADHLGLDCAGLVEVDFEFFGLELNLGFEFAFLGEGVLLHERIGLLVGFVLDRFLFVLFV